MKEGCMKHTGNPVQLTISASRPLKGHDAYHNRAVEFTQRVLGFIIMGILDGGTFTMTANLLQVEFSERYTRYRSQST